MRTDPKARAFDRCLQAMISGATLDEALGLYPMWADELRPMLRLARLAQLSGESIIVPKGAQARSKAKLLSKARTVLQPKKSIFSFASLRFGMAALVVLIGLIFAGLSTIVAAAQALPGDALYPVKIFSERTRLQLVTDPVQRLKLEQEYDRERIKEVDALIQRERSMQVSFTGGLRQMESEMWQVDGIPVHITEETDIQPNIKPGYYVNVEGELRSDGTVAARKIWIRQFQFSGELQSIEADAWMVGGIQFATSIYTQINGAAIVGSQVTITAVQAVDSGLLATVIDVTSPAPFVAPTSTATQTLLPTNTFPAVVLPSKTPVPLLIQASPTQVEEQPEPSETLKPTEGGDHEAPDASETPRPTEGEEQHQTPEPSGTPQPTENDDHGNTPEPSETPQPTENDDHEDPQPSQTPEYSATPTPAGIFQPTLTYTPTLTPTRRHRNSSITSTPTPAPTSTSRPGDD